MKKYLNYPLISLILIVGALTACEPTPPQNYDKAPKELSHFILPEPKILTAFALSTSEGKVFDLEDLKGKWSLVFFGYTNCPDICPTTLTLLSTVFKILEGQSIDTVQGIFVSVDPERDLPETLKKFVAYFHPNILGVTGDKSALDSFTHQMMTSYTIYPPEDTNVPDKYLVSHSSIIYVISPQGQLVGVFPPTLNAKSIATSFKMLTTIVSKKNLLSRSN